MKKVKINIFDGVSLEKEEAGNRELFLILMPTEYCNFRCSYCYEDFKIGKMNEGVTSGIKSYLSKNIFRYHRLQVSWFGGEPLLARDVIFDIQKHILKLLSGNCDIKFQSSMTTNGYVLNGDLLKRMIGLGINRYQITLDGSEGAHNKTRVLVSGRGTFCRIWENIQEMLSIEEHFTLKLRIHYTASNIESVKDLIGMLNDNFPNESRLFIVLKAVEKLGRELDSGIRQLNVGEQYCIEEELCACGPELSFITRRDLEKNYSCYAGSPRSLIVRADGRVGKCTVALKDPRNTVGVLTYDGSISYDKNKLDMWVNAGKSLEGRGCPYSYLRGSDCDNSEIEAKKLLYREL